MPSRLKTTLSDTPHGNTPSEWYINASKHLDDIEHTLANAPDMAHVMEIIRNAARTLTGADGATFVLRDGGFSYYADETAISPLWKGQRFPLEKCISGWAMIHAEPVIIENIYFDPRIPVELYESTFVRSLTITPISKKNPVGAIGTYWAIHRRPSKEEMKILQKLSDITAQTLQDKNYLTQTKTVN